ncbi:MAG: alanine--tRNA ligase [Eubacteriales bacterium]|nr:alanine--tRNA ligase [Eubacteriales bacterium]
MSKYGLNELRQMFLDFFESKDHLIMKSFSLVPKNDNSLLLINSGMAPLKPYFTGQEIPPKNRVATCQKCIRTGDIENVGKTARHGTFFEMLGNFSFGDYFKREAIAWSWEFLTDVVGLSPDRLYPSVYEEDDEAFEIWEKEMHIAPDRIFRFGKADNFWEHGAGPCGPCSEIYYDRGPEYGCDDPNCTVGCECDRYMEVWNNVFTQFENDGEGNYTRLEKTNIDTGMGLERLAVVVQDVFSIFDVDTIHAVLEKVGELSGKKYKDNEKDDISIRLITDHVRSATFMISDGVLPSNEGRGYVLRRLIRRAARHGSMLGIEGTFLAKVAETVIETSKDGYPELAERQAAIYKTMTREEEQFGKTLNQGMEMLKNLLTEYQATGGDTKIISGEDIFKLYDTYGFPTDIAKDYLEDTGYTIDEEGFKAAMKRQRDQARQARAVSNYMGAEATVYDEIDPALTSTFVGYEHHEYEGRIMQLTTTNALTEVLTAGEEGTVFTDETPFYATSGGQAADHGVITSGDAEFAVQDVRKLSGGKIAHVGMVRKGAFHQGDTVCLSIDTARRKDIEANHSATHLLHRALRTVLGDHVTQAGSLVEADRLRFDFTHFEAMTAEEITAVEDMVNADIRMLADTDVDHTSMDKARERGAMALFGEKYGDRVRVVQMGDSVELCGGTHVENTGAIQAFKIITETGIASGVRRIEAVTGRGMLEYVNGQLKLLQDAAAAVKSTPAGLFERLQQMLDEIKEVRRENESLKQKMAQKSLGDVTVETVNGKAFIAQRLDNVDMNALRTLGDDLKAKHPDAVVFLAAANDGRVTLMSMVPDALIAQGVKAGDLIKAAAPAVNGRGGGRPNMAQGGGDNPAGIEDAFAAAKACL